MPAVSNLAKPVRLDQRSSVLRCVTVNDALKVKIVRLRSEALFAQTPPTCEADSRSANQDIPRRFTAACTTERQ